MYEYNTIEFEKLEKHHFSFFFNPKMAKYAACQKMVESRYTMEL